jgi:monoamine oxidase
MLYDVAIIGAGAAGLAAARRLRFTAHRFIVLEARARLGGRGHSIRMGDLVLDLGCEWLHSADRNPLSQLAKDLGFDIDLSAPPWTEQAGNRSFSTEKQWAYREALEEFERRIEQAAKAGHEGPAAAYFEPGSRWTPLIEAFSSYYNGVSFEGVSIQDYAAYQDSGVNWRIRQGLGTMISALGTGCDVALDCAVSLVDHHGRALRLQTSKGPIEARICIVTIPSALIAAETLRFEPALPQKQEAAAGLPLGLADKLFLAVEDPDALPKNAHAYGRPDRAATGSYHIRPGGQPYIECFFGGDAARQLEESKGFEEFALTELSGLFGADIKKTLRPIATTFWRADPYARGSYSHALPGHRADRARLGEPVDNRLFFAGEACSAHSFSTAHGAYETGLAAAEATLSALAQT